MTRWFLKISHKHTPLFTPKNRYTRKQPTHSSMKPLRPKFKKKNFQKLTNHPICYAEKTDA